MPASSDAMGGDTHPSDWSGRVVVRFLSDNTVSDYEIKNKPKHRIDPLELPEMSQTIEENGAQLAGGASENDKNHNAIHVPDNPENCTIRMDISLTSRITGQSIAINLIRHGAEEASKCLKRLELSILKKLSKKKAKGKKNQKVAQASGSSCLVMLHNNDKSKPAQKLDSQNMSNHQFWTFSTTSSMELRLQIGEGIATLPVECNPPTIYKVTAFEDFDCDIFPQVPLVVRVDTLFATRSRIDWYADDERVCQDSPCYVPTFEDADKSLTIIITPLRPEYKSQQYREAYRYKRKVGSTLPPNTTLDVRKEWLSQQKDPSDNRLRVMSYNILADQNAFTTSPERLPFFPYVPKEVLLRSRRFPLILHEILAHKAEVICLQEVDSFVFSSLLQPALEFYNYQGFHSLKQSPGNNEGCATFWSLDRFQKVGTEDMKTFRISELLKECLEDNENGLESNWKECTAPIAELFAKRKDLEEIVLSKLGTSTSYCFYWVHGRMKLGNSKPLFFYSFVAVLVVFVVRKGHVLQLVRLKDREGKEMLVANTHIFFHPMGSHM